MTSEKGKRILFVYTSFSTFVAQDYEILAAQNKVDKFQFELSKKASTFAWQFIRQFVHLLLFGWKYDVFFIWFADYHSFLPVVFAKITGKLSLLVVGGYDAGRIRSLDYGAYTKKVRGFFAIQSIRNCSLNLGVSQYVLQKLKYIAPKAPRTLVYNCVSFDAPQTEHLKENLVLTVASIQTERTFYLKGIDTFIETARQMPNISFLLVGLNKLKLNHLVENIPSNMQIIDVLPHDQLIAYYQRAKIYCQFSYIESFCLTLAESMYFNCSPVITRVGGMPEIVGSRGQIVRRNIEEITQAIQNELNSTPNHTNRSHIEQHFSVQKRKLELEKIIQNTKQQNTNY